MKTLIYTRFIARLNEISYILILIPTIYLYAILFKCIIGSEKVYSKSCNLFVCCIDCVRVIFNNFTLSFIKLITYFILFINVSEEEEPIRISLKKLEFDALPHLHLCVAATSHSF